MTAICCSSIVGTDLYLVTSSAKHLKESYEQPNITHSLSPSSTCFIQLLTQERCQPTLTIMPPPLSPETLPAPATLASTLLSNITSHHPEQKFVATSCKQLDEVLDGGFRYGEITGLAIASAFGTAGGREGVGNGVGEVGRSVSFVIFPCGFRCSVVFQRGQVFGDGMESEEKA